VRAAETMTTGSEAVAMAGFLNFSRLCGRQRLLHDVHHMMRCGICNGRAINCDEPLGRHPGRAIMSVCVWSTPDKATKLGPSA
jgi:hypothetical protein